MPASSPRVPSIRKEPVFMLDNSCKWRPEPDWANARLATPGLHVSAIIGLPQRLVSGDIGGFLVRHELAEVGALGLASGERYAVRVARDRLLAVGIPASACADGWHDDGYGVTTVGSAFRVLQARGEGVPDLVARATTIDPNNPGPCAAMLFCGVMATVYRYNDIETLRIHVDRGLGVYLWEWLEAQPLFSRAAAGVAGR